MNYAQWMIMIADVASIINYQMEGSSGSPGPSTSRSFTL